MSASQLLREQYGHARRALLWTIEDLTDEEYLWAPAPDCWSIVQDADGRWRREFGTTQESKVTTIAWRLTHVGVGSVVYHDYVFGKGSATWDDSEVPSDAASAVALAELSTRRHAEAMRSVRDEQLNDLRPTAWGEQLPLWQMLWTSVVETFHHSAEIGLLLDLYRGRPRTDWWPELQDGRELSDADR